MQIVLALKFAVPPAERENLMGYLRNAIPQYEQPGGIHVSLLEERDQPGRFVELVTYTSMEHFERDQVQASARRYHRNSPFGCRGRKGLSVRGAVI
jgi:quinol monooxygenase YgiN